MTGHASDGRASTERESIARRFMTGDLLILALLALVKVALHFLTSHRYGYFRDELYYLICGEHLDWGYVDQSPLIGVIAWAVRAVLGDSLFAVRFLPAVAGGLLVFLTGLMARELGGSRFAQALAAISIIIAPIYLAFSSFLSMNAFEPLFWTAGAYIALLAIKRDQPRLWPLFGVVAGVGLLNKHSMIFFGFGLVAGLALTRERKHLLSPWMWLGGAIAFIIFLPHLVWQVNHDWPMVELLQNVTVSKNVVLSPLDFFLQQILLLHPLTFPVWMAGLYFYFFSPEGKKYGPLGWCYVVMLATFIILKGKNYYLAPAYPMLLAAGAVLTAQWADRRSWLKPAITALLLIGGAILAPFTVPVLPVETFISYSKTIGIEPPKTENKKMGRLPQNYADMFGWENLTATVAGVYNGLPDSERAACAIYASNYGEAAAIDFFGKAYGLPKAISGHQTYFLWGPREYTGEIIISVGERLEDLQETFDQIEQAALVVNEYAMPYESNLPVYVCRKPKLSLKEVWPEVKKYE